LLGVSMPIIFGSCKLRTARSLAPLHHCLRRWLPLHVTCDVCGAGGRHRAHTRAPRELHPSARGSLCPAGVRGDCHPVRLHPGRRRPCKGTIRVSRGERKQRSRPENGPLTVGGSARGRRDGAQGRCHFVELAIRHIDWPACMPVTHSRLVLHAIILFQS
jgi:hypothetical protein